MNGQCMCWGRDDYKIQEEWDGFSYWWTNPSQKEAYPQRLQKDKDGAFFV